MVDAERITDGICVLSEMCAFFFSLSLVVVGMKLGSFGSFQVQENGVCLYDVEIIFIIINILYIKRVHHSAVIQHFFTLFSMYVDLITDLPPTFSFLL